MPLVSLTAPSRPARPHPHRHDGHWALLVLLPLILLLSACAGKTPQQHYEAGVAAFEAGRVREARIAFMNTLQAEPGHKDARLMQARILLDSGDGVGAEAEIARARQNGATPAETRHLMAHARLLQDDPAAALSEAAGAAPAYASYAQRVAARAHLARNQVPQALAAYDRAIAANPRDAALWTDIARYRRGIGNLAGAAEAVDRALAIAPHDGAALVLRGELTRRQYGLRAALPWFDRAIEIDSGNLNAILERAITYGEMGRMREMLADTRAALALSPEHPLPYYLQATLAARAHMFDLARSLYARTRGAYDRTPAGLMLSAAIAFQVSDFEGANRRLERLVEMQPGNLKARRLLAATRWRMGDPAGTIDAVRPVADRPDIDSYTLTLVAQALERQGNRALAGRYRERAARPQQSARAALLWSGNSRPQVAAVARLLASGDTGAALSQARRLQQDAQGWPEAHLLVGDILGARGDHEGAAQAYRQAANIAFTENVAVRLIEALRRAGHADAADAVLRLFVAQNPRNLSGQLMMAGRALSLGQWPEAVARYERLRWRIGNGDASLLNNLAWAHVGAGDAEEGILFAQRAWRLDTANPVTAETLGWALFRNGDVAEGLAMMLASFRGRPADALIRQTQVAAR